MVVFERDVNSYQINQLFQCMSVYNFYYYDIIVVFKNLNIKSALFILYPFFAYIVNFYLFLLYSTES